jgi:anti-anti-sigma regulatory factor
MLDSARMTTSNTVRALYTIRDASSRVERSVKETQALAETGTQIMICELTGEQSFVTSEALSTDLLREMEDRRYLVLDFERITGIDLASSKVFQELIRQLGQMGKKVIISGIQDKFSFRKRLIGALPATGQTGVIEIPELDQSMQFCEEQLLQEQFGELSADQSVSLANQPLCAGLDGGELAWLETLIERQSFQPGDLICDAGSVADGVYLIKKGKVDVLLKGDRGKPYKVASYCGGAVFGEAAFFPQSTRSANVVAISQVDVYLLRPSSLEASKQDLTTGVRMKLYKNLANLGFARLRAVNKILLTLTG